MSLRRLLPLLTVLLLAVACGRSDGGVTGTEQEDGDFLRAQDLKKRDQSTEALAAYLKVIARRGELAPESYLDAGLIYFQKLKDPFKAWYYLQHYLELQPNSPRRDEVRQQVVAAERDALFQRLAQSQFGGGELVQLQEQVDQLTRENARLEGELKMARSVPSGTVTHSEISLAGVANTAAPISVGPASAAASSSGQINLNPTIPSPQAAIVMPLPGTPKANTPPDTKGTAATQKGTASAQKAAPPAQKSAPAAAGRTHTVRSGDTLFKLAAQYYNGDKSAARLNALRQANRDVLKNGDALSVGMTLKIP